GRVDLVREVAVAGPRLELQGPAALQVEGRGPGAVPGGPQLQKAGQEGAVVGLVPGQGGELRPGLPGERAVEGARTGGRPGQRAHRGRSGHTGRGPGWGRSSRWWGSGSRSRAGRRSRSSSR